MKPKVIIHNTISIDGEMLGFEIDSGLHYKIAKTYNPDIHLVSAQTLKQGIKDILGEIPKESSQDFFKPIVNRNDKRPIWVIVDTRGYLRGLLHVLRRSSYCKDIVVLVCKTTPRHYLKYLKERNYDFILTGDFKVDFKKTFVIFQKKHRVKTILTDGGPALNGILLEKGLVDEISLLIAPIIVGKKDLKVFETLKETKKLQLKSCKNLSKGYIWLTYKVLN